MFQFVAIDCGVLRSLARGLALAAAGVFSLFCLAAPAIAADPAPAPVVVQPVPKLTPAEFEQGKQIYFDRCSGCHGTLRKGATGPVIDDTAMRQKTLATIQAARSARRTRSS